MENQTDSELEFECKFKKNEYILEETETHFILKGHSHIVFKRIEIEDEFELLSPRFIVTSPCIALLFFLIVILCFESLLLEI